MMNQINLENLNEWFFMETEGQLNAQELAELNDFLAIHPEEIITRKLWKSANFESIEIEAYPKLETLLKGKSPWWEEKWFVYNSIALVLFFGILFGFQTPETDLKLGDLSALNVKVLRQLNFDTLTTEKAIDLDLQYLSESPSSEFEFKKPLNQLIGKNKLTETKEPKSSTSIKIERTAEQTLDPKEVSEIFILSTPDSLVIKKDEANIPEQSRQEKRSSRKRERRHNRNTRKRENAIYEQSQRNGSDPLIIPLGDFGF